MSRRKVVCFAAIFFASAGHADLFGDTKELSEVQSGIKNVKENMQQIQLQKQTINTQLAEIEKRYGETFASLRALEGKINQKNRSLDRIRKDMQAHQDELALQNQELAGQIKAAYAMGRKEKLKLLLNQQDPALSGRMIVYYNYLNAERLAKLTDIQKSLAKLDELDKQEQEEAALLAEDVQKKKTEQVDLVAVRKQRNELLLQLSNDFSTNEQQLGRLKESENKLRSLIASWQNAESSEDTGAAEHKEDAMVSSDDGADAANAADKDNFPAQNKAFATLKGKLPWPARGRSMAKLGGNEETTVSDGVLIDAKEGAEIRAVTGGKVAYAEWLKGYGLLMIINHGNGYMTLYAFNQSLYKKVGDVVDAGEVIASVGQSGGRTQSGLYFGIRKNGQPIDPIEWCRK
ncbi:MAG: peptidoglycan DD-metalloendopeptidase family protein [Methylococcales bacterium]